MAAVRRLLSSRLQCYNNHILRTNHPSFPPHLSSSFPPPPLQNFHFSSYSSGVGWSRVPNSAHSSSSSSSSWAFMNGWRSRVSADPQFPFKVAMEQFVCVTSAVLGDMITRPNFGLDKLDFVFSTLIVTSILNFLLMYLLAPTSSFSSTRPTLLPSIFATCPASHMFEPGPYSLLNRFGTFLYEGALFASNGLISMRRKIDPGFETRNEARDGSERGYVGVSSNLRYQGC